MTIPPTMPALSSNNNNITTSSPPVVSHSEEEGRSVVATATTTAATQQEEGVISSIIGTSSSSSSSSYTLPTPITNEIKSQIHQAFINDKFCTDCEHNQKRPFIRTGVKPVIGQRIELTIFLMEHIRRLPFRLSGEVISVGPAITIDEWRPATSTDDSGPGKGSMCCADAVQYHTTQQVVEIVEANEAWGVAYDQMPEERKEFYKNQFERSHGALHGQRIVCEGRLNFDYDMRRSSEEGPYSDLIPFDARDVWRFTVEFDDRYEQNLWWADVSTFVNMGRNHRDRCWPWKKGNKLPYKRKANDMPLTGHGPNGEISVHISIGPFGPKRTYIYPSRAA